MLCRHYFPINISKAIVSIRINERHKAHDTLFRKFDFFNQILRPPRFGSINLRDLFGFHSQLDSTDPLLYNLHLLVRIELSRHPAPVFSAFAGYGLF